MPDEYVAPECKWDYPAAYRAQILSDVMLHGETDRCAADLSNAFEGWDYGQIDHWCTEYNLAIIARHEDGRIIILHATREALAAYGIETPAIIHALEEQRAVLCAEVEAMDWPEVIGE
jgi:hypothetical protein